MIVAPRPLVTSACITAARKVQKPLAAWHTPSRTSSSIWSSGLLTGNVAMAGAARAGAKRPANSRLAIVVANCCDDSPGDLLATVELH